MIDWQTIVSGLIIAAACGYITRRVYSGFRALVSTENETKSLCSSGCGSCQFRMCVFPRQKEKFHAKAQRKTQSRKEDSAFA